MSLGRKRPIKDQGLATDYSNKSITARSMGLHGVDKRGYQAVAGATGNNDATLQTERLLERLTDNQESGLAFQSDAFNSCLM